MRREGAVCSGKTIVRPALRVCIGAVMGVSAIAAAGRADAEASGFWQKLSGPEPEGQWVFETVVDSEGTPYVVRDDGFFFWKPNYCQSQGDANLRGSQSHTADGRHGLQHVVNQSLDR